MPQTYGLPEEEPTLTERAEPMVRLAIAGHERGSVRRIALYVVVGFTQVALIGLCGLAGILIGGLGIIALLLLAMTDQIA